VSFREPCVLTRTLPFTGSRGARTLSGVLTGGFGDILNNVHIGALNASDPEIFLISLRAYPLPGYGHMPFASTVEDVPSLG
jgi:hypothetical protein